MPEVSWKRRSWHVTSWLSVVCFAQFLLQVQDPEGAKKWLAFEPGAAVHRFELWRFFTYPFFFEGPVTFVFTVLILMLLGTALEALWGSAEYLAFLLVSTVGASAMAAIFGVPLIGSYGLYFNMLVVYAIHFPDTVFYIYFVLPVKVKWLAWLAAGLVVMSQIGGRAGIPMILGTSSGLIFWAIRLRSRSLSRAARMKMAAAAAVLAPSRDPRTEAVSFFGAARQLSEGLKQAGPGAGGSEDAAAALEAMKSRIIPAVNVCPAPYFDAGADFCQTCNGFYECALRSQGLVDLPMRKAGGTTATGAADAIAAFTARERDEKARARRAASAPGRPAIENP